MALRPPQIKTPPRWGGRLVQLKTITEGAVSGQITQTRARWTNRASQQPVSLFETENQSRADPSQRGRIPPGRAASSSRSRALGQRLCWGRAGRPGAAGRLRAEG